MPYNTLEQAIHNDYHEYKAFGATKLDKWKFNALSRNSAISVDFIIEHSDISWDWSYLTNEMPFDFISEYPDYPWDWYILSQKASVEIVETFPDKKWNWKVLSGKKEIVTNLLLKHPEYPWDYDILSKNQIGISNRNRAFENATQKTNPEDDKKAPEPTLLHKNDRHIDTPSYTGYESEVMQL